MQNRLAKMVLPAVLALFSCAPAFAQIRLGLDLGDIRIHIAQEAPPPPRMEVRMARPSQNHVWIQGYWDRQDDQWAWARGRWEQPTQRGSLWVKPQYRQESGAYRYEPGHWSHQRMVEGEDYSRWHKERGKSKDKHGRGHDKDKDDDKGRNNHGRNR